MIRTRRLLAVWAFAREHGAQTWPRSASNRPTCPIGRQVGRMDLELEFGRQMNSLDKLYVRKCLQYSSKAALVSLDFHWLGRFARGNIWLGPFAFASLATATRAVLLVARRENEPDLIGLVG